MAVSNSCFEDMTALCEKYCPKDLDAGDLARLPQDDEENRKPKDENENEEKEELEED